MARKRKQSDHHHVFLYACRLVNRLTHHRLISRSISLKWDVKLLRCCTYINRIYILCAFIQWTYNNRSSLQILLMVTYACVSQALSTSDVVSMIAERFGIIIVISKRLEFPVVISACPWLTRFMHVRAPTFLGASRSSFLTRRQFFGNRRLLTEIMLPNDHDR